ncbi:MAG TPA: uroporphyrinogen decarboxylase family protein [Spirochaetia bacterium]|nr:uroporphyrinogen decarboxylase family protein [Spirochaetia bacterium]
MTDAHWTQLLEIIDGKVFDRPLAAFIIDSPWLPAWAGISILDYFSSEQKWYDANLKAIDEFPEIAFLPGFWSEFGMCTEPSAFGTKCIWGENEFPTAVKLPSGVADIVEAGVPNPATDGLCPLVLKRLEHFESPIQAGGHQIRFAVARGPLNIASFLMGTTEFLTAMKTDPVEIEKLLELITDFIVDWLRLQKNRFPSIDGIFLLDDIAGFIGPDDFVQSGKPYFTRAFAAFDASVKLFHNDAHGLVCAPHLREMGVNVFNFSHNHSVADIRRLAGDSVVLLGNIPPRDVLAAGTEAQVTASAAALVRSLPNARRVIFSCGGGMPPGVSSANIRAFLVGVGH